MGDNKTVRIKLLGTFPISRGKLSVSELLVSKESQSWKLLKYLCANCGRMIDADELTRELIFAGSENNIGNTLRVRLRRARAILDHIGLGGAMDGLILYGGGKYCINPELDIKIDVREADRLCRRAADKTLDIKRRLTLCIEALRLYDGPCRAQRVHRSHARAVRCHVQGPAQADLFSHARDRELFRRRYSLPQRTAGMPQGYRCARTYHNRSALSEPHCASRCLLYQRGCGARKHKGPPAGVWNLYRSLRDVHQTGGSE